MGEFTDQDRNMMVETHTLVKQIDKNHVKRLDDLEIRVRKNETVITKVIAFASLGAMFVTGAIKAFFNKFS
jgi:hypothetical protein